MKKWHIYTLGLYLWGACLIMPANGWAERADPLTEEVEKLRQEINNNADKIDAQYQKLLDAQKAQNTAVNVQVPMFRTIPYMIEQLGEFSELEGTFRMLKTEDVPHFQLATVMALTPRELQAQTLQIEEAVKRLVIIGVYRTFIHTPHDEVTVTGIPLAINPANPTRRNNYLQSYSVTLTVSRTKALAVARNLFKVNKLSDLLKLNDEQATLQEWAWIPAFEKAMHNNRSLITINVHYQQLAGV